MFDIIALGELLIDFTSRGNSDAGNMLYEANPGGAPCNVLAAMARLGKKTAFVGKVGTDTFGTMLKNYISGIGIDTSALYMTDRAFTTLAFVTLDETGNREFSFARHNSADLCLEESEIDGEMIKNARVFHCGTLSLCDEPARSATIKALEIARENGVKVSVDPNLREMLWRSKEDAVSAMFEVMKRADIIKISDYELEYLYGTKDVAEGIKCLQADVSADIIFATCGKHGAYMVCNGKVYSHPCFDVKTVDTTGAGDSFCGTALSCLIDRGLDFAALTDSDCEYIIKYANAAASLATAKRGAIPAMPVHSEIDELIKSGKVM